MSDALYTELAHWWPVMTPPHLLADEAAQILRWLGAQSVLELGSGAGLLATNWPSSVHVELVDLAPEMLAVSEALNPGRAHHCADLRTLRLDRLFDGVVLHDAVMYLLDEADLRAAFATAFLHTRPGGHFVVLPDGVADDFEEHVSGGGGETDTGAIQLMEWHWDPDPDDCRVNVEFSVLVRENGQVRALHETHTMGCHPRETYWRLLQEAGFVFTQIPWDDLRGEGEAWLLRRPESALAGG